MTGVSPETVTAFWLNEVGEGRWYEADPALDAEISRRFGDAWEIARQGGLSHWRCSAQRALAFILLTDQFPRNMFRGDGRAFSTDLMALAAAKQGLVRGWDMLVPEPQRQFYYLPLMHSERAEDQERAVRLILTRMPQGGGSNLLHARAHRDVIRSFGRFPHRNADLGRTTTGAEQAFLAAGGYGSVVRALAG